MGRRFDRFWVNTADRSAAERAKAACAGVSTGVPGAPVEVRPTRPKANIWVSIRSTSASTVDTGTNPWVTPADRSATEAGFRGVGAGRQRRRIVDGTEIGADESGEPPLLQDRRQSGVLALECPVQLGIGAHDRSNVRLHHRRLERRQIDLIQRRGGHLCIERPPVGLLTVGDQVLGVGEDALELDALDVGDAHGGDEERILAVPFEGAAALRHAIDVQVRPLDDVDALAPNL
jgi:hypothetical protein